jgi:hypothetical protein
MSTSLPCLSGAAARGLAIVDVGGGSVQSPLTPRTEPEARDLGITMDDAADASGADAQLT